MAATPHAPHGGPRTAADAPGEARPSLALSLRVVEREARVFRRTWRSAAITAVASPVFMLLALGVGVGRLVTEGASGGQVAGLDYVAFVAPGLLAATAMQHAAGQSLWPVLGGFKWMRTYHGMAASPLRPVDVLVGGLAWTALLITASSSVFLAAAALVGGVGSVWGVLAVPAAVLSALAFATPLSAFSATQESDAAFAVLMRLVVAPLVLFSGTVFPISQLPGGLQAAAQVSPLYHGVELCRPATTGTLAASDAGHVAVLGAVVGASLVVAARTYRRRLGP